MEEVQGETSAGQAATVRGWKQRLQTSQRTPRLLLEPSGTQTGSSRTEELRSADNQQVTWTTRCELRARKGAGPCERWRNH